MRYLLLCLLLVGCKDYGPVPPGFEEGAILCMKVDHNKRFVSDGGGNSYEVWVLDSDGEFRAMPVLALERCE